MLLEQRKDLTKMCDFWSFTAMLDWLPPIDGMLNVPRFLGFNDLNTQEARNKYI